MGQIAAKFELNPIQKLILKNRTPQQKSQYPLLLTQKLWVSYLLRVKIPVKCSRNIHANSAEYLNDLRGGQSWVIFREKVSVSLLQGKSTSGISLLPFL